MVTLRQLRYFDALARHGHFGRAAAECAVTQPALSQQIRDLEAFLGTALVERHPGRIVITDAGLECARRARAVLEDVGDLVEVIRRQETGLGGRLRLGIIPSVAPYLLPAVLPEIHRRHPALDLEIREALTGLLTEDLVAGRLDAVVVALPAEGTGLIEAPLFEDRFLLATRRNAGRAEAELADVSTLAQERLLLLEEGHCLREQALTYCRAINPVVRNEFGATSLATIVQMVANGYGVTLLPEIAVRSGVAGDPRISVLPFRDPQPSRTVGLVWRRSSRRTKDFREFAALVRDALAPKGAKGARPLQRAV
ncbi:transcriptional regulator, LysR family [Pseudoxanthobacter soli DSM 19599]|uniref:Transcriptional regulator, LysR family n=1 Tax=Pseudoxanthobacter soli DSM 19599 TaxID=1123029 RepID=A0A1M7Z9A0_9HYPH|nr:hydrogen peroxide-inducible genes activator [Pseudoxanthobacter soli]SHO61399.1 transcriptional regulator, LysR family [Pseudoxanthobacter soli DSM 19599]